MVDHLASPPEAMRDRYDVVVVGSGYGGAIAASRLARAGRSVCLLERGVEKQPGDYPDSTADLLQEVQLDGPHVRVGSRTALFDVRYNENVNVIVGCGLGGTSLINAGICLRPDGDVFTSSAWPQELREAAALDPYFASAERMLRPALSTTVFLGSAKSVSLRRAAARTGKSATPAPVLVNFEHLTDDRNHVGVTQYPCVGCGDCVSGCNYHAKSTLIMNYLPDARNHSAALFTRSNARYVEAAEQGWSVHGHTLDERGAESAFTVGADIVILSAGTLGSTEILLRSGERGLPLSSQVGAHFSGNGDTIGFAYNAANHVDGVGLGARRAGGRVIGPCSTEVVTMHGDDLASTMLMADGTVPGAFADLLAPLLKADARLKGVDTSRGARDWIAERWRELQTLLLGPHAGAMRNTLFMLVVTHDDSAGRMFLDDDRLRVDWPGLGDQGQFSRASDAMLRVTRELDGTYVQNPVWNELTHHDTVTGHPLGGCVMADGPDQGVVNDKGQVFRGGSGGVHEGLYVMDGSVVPTALGVNPLLTISALAERSCHALATDRGWTIDYGLG